jgi:hypothetical protein
VLDFIGENLGVAFTTLLVRSVPRTRKFVVRESSSGNGMAICGGAATGAIAAPRKSLKP